jgi:hypothetical protein
MYNDQFYRNMQIDTGKKYGYNSAQFFLIGNKIQKTDSINILKIRAILDKYGWLGEDVIGKDGNRTLAIIMIHTDVQIQEKYYPLMKKAVKQHKLAPDLFALFTDKIDVNRGRPQTYGTQLHGYNDKVIIFDPIRDEKNVNKRRKAVGLPPIEDYKKMMEKIYLKQ